MKIILGSGSKWRKLMLEKMGYEFEVVTADINEKEIRCDDYYILPVKLAGAKADAISKKINEPIILITADQVVLCNGELREKPSNIEEGRRYLQSYGHYPAEIVNGVVVTNNQNDKRASGVDIATVYFKEIPEEVIDRLLTMKEILNAAGAFLAEHELLRSYVIKYEGKEGNSLALPKELTERLISEVK